MAKKSNEKSKPTFMVTGLVRASYPHVFEKYAFKDEEPRYSITILIPKTDKKTIEAIEKTQRLAFEEGGENMFGKIPFSSAKIEKPLKDGDDKLEEKPEQIEYKDMYYLKATSWYKPKVVDRDANIPIIDSDEIYAGCWVRVSLEFKAYNNVQKGVSARLYNVQKWKDDERFGGSTSNPEDDFNDDFEDEGYDDSLD
jgi:hypothetical protein